MTFDSHFKSRPVYSVSALNREVRDLLENSFGALWVSGEISNLARPASGHVYFSLKDEKASIRCAMFRSRNRQLGFSPGNGQKVLASGAVSLYEGRGDFQLIVHDMEPSGLGDLQIEFERRKDRLREAGWFDAERKRPLPREPQTIGVVTSPHGAAIRDIISVLERRFPVARIRIFPVSVQGAGSAEEITKGIRLASDHGDCDVIIVSRGGGSIEDLWGFNEESVALAIFESKVPVVTGIGHEIDNTIADFVADARAPTPSAAAEIVVPSADEQLLRFKKAGARMRSAFGHNLRLWSEQVRSLEKGLGYQHPKRQLQEFMLRLDETVRRLNASQKTLMGERQMKVKSASARLSMCSPAHEIELATGETQKMAMRLSLAFRNRFQDRSRKLGALVRQLDTVSPLATLHRGYSITRLHDSGNLLSHIEGVVPGDEIETRLVDGVVYSRAEKTARCEQE